MLLEEILELNKMSKTQLVQLCNALYELLQQRNVPLPALTFIPSNPPTPFTPYVPPVIVPQGTTTVPYHYEVTCQNQNEGCERKL